MAPEAQKQGDRLSQAALDVVVRSYENYKNHARFQETQRSWFFIAYLGVAGAVGAAILNRLLQPQPLLDPPRQMITIALAVLLVTGVLIGMAIIKVGEAFRRHSKQADEIVTRFRNRTSDPAVKYLLQAAALVASEEAERRGRPYGAAAIHIYLMSVLIGIEAAGMAAIWLPKPLCAIAIAVGVAALTCVMMNRHRQWLERLFTQDREKDRTASQDMGAGETEGVSPAD